MSNTITLMPTWKVLKSVRGKAIPPGRTIESIRDKERRQERQRFRQNRRRMDW
jgi:hypothetical protein